MFRTGKIKIRECLTVSERRAQKRYSSGPCLEEVTEILIFSATLMTIILIGTY
jgi:hypothetical protein